MGKEQEGYDDREFECAGEYVNDYGDFNGLSYKEIDGGFVFMVFDGDGDLFETELTTKEQGLEFVENSRDFLGI